MTTTAPIPPADAALVEFLETVERAIIDAYDKVMPLLGDSAKSVAGKLQVHHRDYVDALDKLAGGVAAGAKANQTLALVLAARLQSATDEKSSLTVTAGIENQLAETYAFAFTTITSLDVINLLATILPMVATHAATLSALAILPTATVFPNGPFEGTAVAGTDNTQVNAGFDPAAFPTG